MDCEPSSNNSTFCSASNYIVSAQKPTVVNGCVVGNFRNAEDLDLIIARINRIEMLIMADEGLKPHREIPIFGRIAIIKAFKAPGEKKDSLLILTYKYQLAVLGFDQNGEVRTRASGSVYDRVARPSETGMLASIHKNGLIALRLYDGLLKIVQWSDDKDLTCFNLRFGDPQITDFTFLDTKDFHGRPTIAYIYEDANGRHLKVAAIDTREKEFHLAWKQDNIESEASILIPIPYYGGAIVIGQEAISYHRGSNDYVAVAPPLIHMAQIVCYALVDKHGERILLGDIEGKLFMLVLHTKQGERYPEVDDLKIQYLGETSIPECMVYLDNSVVFVGSRLGDSQLIRLLPEPGDNPNNPFVDVIDSFTNLGPIRDMIIVNSDGQNQVITCSGGFKEGSLRIIRSGIGIEEQAEIELKNVRSLFSFNLDSKLDNYLLVSFNQATHLLKINEEELEETNIEGLEIDKSTLFAGILTQSGNLLQITESSVNLIDKNGKLLSNHPTPVSLCSVNLFSGQILLASRSKLIYAQTNGSTLNIITETDFNRDVSCLDLALFDENAPSPVAAIGLWDDSMVLLFKLSDGKFEKINETVVIGDVLSRSILLTRMDQIIYLMVALGNGTLHYYQVNEQTGELMEEKKATLGTRPVKLKRFFARNTVNVFACSDRPAVIYSSNQKLVFSNVNLKAVNEMCSLNSSSYPGSLVLADADRFFIGVIDDIQKLHIRTVPLFECVNRIAHQEETKTIAIITTRDEPPRSAGDRFVRPSAITNCTSRNQIPATSGSTSVARSSDDDLNSIEVNSICILDASTFEVLFVSEFPDHERVVSLCAAELIISDARKNYYVVGTAIFNEEDPECKLGRICVFAYESGKLRLVAEKEVKGAVYSIATLNGKLVCSINSSVRLFALPTEQELRMESASFNFTNALYVKTKGDLVLVGDLIRSMSLLAYKQNDSQFDETARDYSAEWLTGCEIVDADTAIGCENAYNLFTCYKDVQADAEDDRMKFQQVGYWYLGEIVNVFKRGNLLTSNMDPTTAYSNPILYGTGDGGLGVIVQLPAQIFKYLESLQKNIANVIKNCTRIDYNDYRNFQNPIRSTRHSGFVDGDLIESVADMPREKISKIIAGLSQPPNSDSKGPATVEEMLCLIEDLTRLH